MYSCQKGVDFMIRISRQDYNSLEAKIQAAIKQVFSEFLEDLEHKTAGTGETGAAREPQESELPLSTPFGEGPPAAAGTKRARPSKSAIEVSRILYGSSHTGIQSPGKILEEDMAKIFRKKHRRGSH